MAGLFRKKPTKNDPSSRRKLKDFEEGTEEEVYDEFQMSGDDQVYAPLDEDDELVQTEDTDGIGMSGVKEFSEILGRLEEIEDKIGRIDSALTTEKSEGSKNRERLNLMEQDIRKLLSVYEIVSAKFNPFIDVSDREAPDTRVQPQATPEIEFPESGLGLDEDLPEFRPFGEGGAQELSGNGRISRTSRDTAPWEPETPVEPGVTATVRAKMLSHQTKRDRPSKDERDERDVRASARSKHNKKPLLAYICHDYLTLVLVMRWIEFMFERVPRGRISLVLDYYVDVGWISEDVKSEVMSYARGEMQDVNKYMEYEEAREEVFKDLPTPETGPYKKVEDWRLTADDHLKSLLFIQKIAGFEIDKDRLNSLEQNISKFKESLEGFHGV
jgi:flagellar protein FlaD